MTSALASSWSLADKLIQKMRFERAARKIPSDSSLVDIGCGSGAFLMYMNKVISQGTGLDAYIENAELNTNIKLIKCRIGEEVLPLEDSSVDVVTALAVLEHLESPDQTISEIQRILRPGGRLILTTPTPMAKSVLEFLAFRCGIISRQDIEDHKHYYNKSELYEKLREFRNINYKSFQLYMNQIVVAEK